MSSRDVVYSWNEIPVDSGGDEDTFSITGAVRLFNVWLTRGSHADLATVVLKNKDSSGDVLLQFDWAASPWPSPNTNIEIPGGGILFPDGLWFDSGNGANLRIQTATLLYQKG